MQTVMVPQMELNADKLQISRQETPRELRLWLIDQLVILAEAYGESMTTERLRLYSEDLVSDLEKPQLEIALTRARRELKFFPKIAELRELAGAKPEDANRVEADAAWQFANRYLQRYGVVKYDRDNRPPLPPRVDYALRRIGGLWGLNQATTDSYPFKYKDFCEAYKQWPVAESMALQLEEELPTWQLLGEIQLKLAHGPDAAGTAGVVKTISEPLRAQAQQPAQDLGAAGGPDPSRPRQGFAVNADRSQR